MKREEEYRLNMKLTYGVLLKHCSPALPNSVRATADFKSISSYEDVSALWVEVKCLYTVGVMTIADAEKVQCDADSQCWLRQNNIS